MPLLQLVVGQANALAAEHQRNRCLFSLRDTFQAAFTRIEHWPRQRARTGAGTDNEAAAGQRFVKGIDDLGVADHVAGSGRQGDGLRVWLHQRVNQPQVR